MTPEIVAVTGKGGAGKTTFTAIAAKLLISQGHRPLIIDADPPVSLAIALGIGSVATIGDYRKRLIEDPGERKKIGERHMRDVLIEEALVEQPGYSFFAIGRAEGPGCYCGINELLKYGIESLAERYELTLVDCEAGIEQINRRVLGSINTLLIVSDPTIKGLRTAAHLKKIATELVGAVRSSVTIDWNLKESVRAAMRAKIRRLLAKYDYPPDYEDAAVDLVIEQAELFAANEAE